MRRSISLVALLVATTSAAHAQPRPALTVRQIMQDQKTWIGATPTPAGWDERGAFFYFNWNPGGAAMSDSLYRIPRAGGTPEKVPAEERRRGVELFDGARAGEGVYTPGGAQKTCERDGDVFVLDTRTGAETRLTQTRAPERTPRFAPDGRAVVYAQGDNLYRHALSDGSVRQLTDFRTGTAPADARPDAQAAFLRRQQRELFGTVRDRIDRREAREGAEKADARTADAAPAVYLAGKTLGALGVAPTERFVSFTLGAAAGAKNTVVPAWVTESGYVEDLTSRANVGQPLAQPELFVTDLARDTTYRVDLHTLPGASDKPAYRREVYGDTVKARRALVVTRVLWAPDGRSAVADVRALDYKTRWLARLDPATGTLTALDVQQDDAWIGGPGVGGGFGGGTLGWMADGKTLYFQSEATGFSHLYALDVATGAKRALTSGAFEVSNVRLARDGRTFTFESSEASPYEIHLYAMPAGGGARTRLTTLAGHNRASPDPRGELLAFSHARANAPPDLYLGRPGREPRRITSSTTEAWRAYPWREAEIVEVPASDGARVPARIYRPEATTAPPNGAAVLFVHGAGYLQNVHRGWSSYSREYMFHNLLADRGYTVLDLDYRASSGLGRSWRTGVYRHMGGRDLQDYVDASKYVRDTFGIEPDRVFIYGGSYGGFITLMALLTEPEHFGGGAALRSVTDWAHYNHGYTANILNTPALDSLAYRASSPIYFADGYQGDPLLIAHGMVDTNVHFQDVVRLSQRFIELGKTGWEMAVYPVEDHAFTEPTSWTDEYRRILDLIERSVGPNRTPRAYPE